MSFPANEIKISAENALVVATRNTLMIQIGKKFDSVLKIREGGKLPWIKRGQSFQLAYNYNYQNGIDWFYGIRGEQTISYESASSWFILNDDPDSLYHMGLCCINQKNKNLTEAFKYFKRAFEKEHLEAMVDYAICLENGFGTDPSPDQAMELYILAAEIGEARAQYILATLLLEKNKNIEFAVTWLVKSAEQNLSEAQFLLGKCYEQGMGVEKNDKTAVGYYQKAILQGEKRAGVAPLNLLTTDGVKWLINLRVKPATSAEFEIALRYKTGRNFLQNMGQAILRFQNIVKRNLCGTDYDIPGNYYGRKTERDLNILCEISAMQQLGGCFKEVLMHQEYAGKLMHMYYFEQARICKEIFDHFRTSKPIDRTEEKRNSDKWFHSPFIDNKEYTIFLKSLNKLHNNEMLHAEILEGNHSYRTEEQYDYANKTLVIWHKGKGDIIIDAAEISCGNLLIICEHGNLIVSPSSIIKVKGEMVCLVDGSSETKTGNVQINGALIDVLYTCMVMTSGGLEINTINMGDIKAKQGMFFGFDNEINLKHPHYIPMLLTKVTGNSKEKYLSETLKIISEQIFYKAVIREPRAKSREAESKSQVEQQKLETSVSASSSMFQKVLFNAQHKKIKKSSALPQASFNPKSKPRELIQDRQTVERKHAHDEIRTTNADGAAGTSASAGVVELNNASVTNNLVLKQPELLRMTESLDIFHDGLNVKKMLIGDFLLISEYNSSYENGLQNFYGISQVAKFINKRWIQLLPYSDQTDDATMSVIKSARQYLTKRSASDPDSYFHDALCMLFEPRDAAKNVTIAKYFKFAYQSNQRHLPAFVAYATCLEIGFGVEINRTLAAKYYEKAAELDDPNAQYALACMLLEGHIVEQNIDYAVSLLRNAVEHYHARAQYLLGFLYAEGIGVPKDDKIAVDLFLKATKEGKDRAFHAFGDAPIELRTPEGARWLAKSMEPQDLRAVFELAIRYLEGKTLKKNIEKAILLFEMLVRHGLSNPVRHTPGWYFSSNRQTELDTLWSNEIKAIELLGKCYEERNALILKGAANSDNLLSFHYLKKSEQRKTAWEVKHKVIIQSEAARQFYASNYGSYKSIIQDGSNYKPLIDILSGVANAVHNAIVFTSIGDNLDLPPDFCFPSQNVVIWYTGKKELTIDIDNLECCNLYIVCGNANLRIRENSILKINGNLFCLMKNKTVIFDSCKIMVGYVFAILDAESIYCTTYNPSYLSAKLGLFLGKSINKEMFNNAVTYFDEELFLITYQQMEEYTNKIVECAKAILEKKQSESKYDGEIKGQVKASQMIATEPAAIAGIVFPDSGNSGSAIASVASVASAASTPFIARYYSMKEIVGAYEHSIRPQVETVAQSAAKKPRWKLWS